MGRHLGLASPKLITTIEDDDSYGRVERRPPASWFEPEMARVDGRVRRFVEQHAMAGFAGALAEKRFTGRNNHKGASHDYRMICDLAEPVCYSSEEFDAYIEWLRRRTAALITNELVWEQIEYVADALLARGSLTAHEFRAVLQEWQDATVRRWQERRSSPR